MGSKKGYRKHPRNSGVDMSLPPEERGRKKKGAGRVGGAPSAQMSHASNPRARKKAREGEKRMRRERG